jgi:hypothetical protein
MAVWVKATQDRPLLKNDPREMAEGGSALLGQG